MSPLCGSVWRRAHRRDNGGPGLWSFAWEEAVSPLALHFLPICRWWPFSCCPVAESRGGGSVWVLSPSPLRRCSFFHHPNPDWFLQPEVVATYLPGAGTLGWVVRTAARIPCSQGIPPIFIYHLWMWNHHSYLHVSLHHTMSPCLSASLPFLSVWMNVAALNPWLSDFHTAWFSDDSGWYLFCSVAVFFCYSCARRWGMFTCASILSRNLVLLIFYTSLV